MLIIPAAAIAILAIPIWAMRYQPPPPPLTIPTTLRYLLTTTACILLAAIGLHDPYSATCPTAPTFYRIALALSIAFAASILIVTTNGILPDESPAFEGSGDVRSPAEGCGDVRTSPHS